MLYLRQLPISEIKIDRMFIAGLGRNNDDEAIVAGLVRLGHAVGVKVVAEGVELASQVEHLAELGCNFAQAFYYGRPGRRFPRRVRSVSKAADVYPAGSTNRRTARIPAEARNIIRTLVEEGASLHSMAAALNRQGVRTAGGSRWSATSVARAIDALLGETRQVRLESPAVNAAIAPARVRARWAMQTTA
jgi:hypothetical protein